MTDKHADDVNTPHSESQLLVFYIAASSNSSHHCDTDAHETPDDGQIKSASVAIGSDYRSFEVKAQLMPELRSAGHIVLDFGCYDESSVDYPDIAYPLATSVATGKSELGVLLDGYGMGMCIAANKVNGIHAAVVADQFSAVCARQLHECNIVCMPCEIVGGGNVAAIVHSFLASNPLSGRHVRRTDKLRQIEETLERDRMYGIRMNVNPCEVDDG